MGKGSRNRVTARDAYRKNWPLGPAKGGAGTFIIVDGELAPATCTARLRKNDAKNIVSLAAGVQADQVPQARRDVEVAGLSGVRYRKNGDVEFKTRQAKLRFLKHGGLHDNDEVRG